MEKIEHIGIAVPDLETASALFGKLLNTDCYKVETVEKDGVKTAFFMIGPNKIELLIPTRPDSPIQKFLDKKGAGMHHIAFAVDHIEGELARLKTEGFQLIDETPRDGADNKLVAFLHPKTTEGVLVELCQEKPL